ncbi:MAG: CoA ester lyase [Rhodospirillales bacterium]|jgi:citrate lyase subunit beta/citryl-CoA lyase|nr:CoA ester lyase [Rhodospirillales bacterium]
MTDEAHIRPRRSALYMPASNARALEKARGLEADVLILDLEDSVAPESKLAARDGALAALAEGGFGGRECVLRVNGLATVWGEDDLRAAAQSKADAVLLPKVESAPDIHKAETLLGNFAGSIWCMIETPKGVLAAADIANASRRLGCLVLGTSDLAKDLRCAHTPDRLPLLYSLSHVLLAARAHGLACLDGVHLDLNDEAGFERACLQGREMGFDGKTLIHPKTIEVANRVFSPSEAEVAQARNICAAFEAAKASGKGVVVVNGRLVEHLHVMEAKRILALAAAISR